MNRWVEQPEDSGGGGYTENITIRIGNQSGTTMSGATVKYDDTLSILVSEAFPTNIPTGGWRDLTCLNQDGWFSIRIRFTSAHTPKNVTYNGQTIAFDFHGDGTSVWYMLIEIPENYEEGTQIIIS